MLCKQNYDFGFSELSSSINTTSSSYQEYTKSLNNFYQIICSQVLSHQSLTTGLFPIYGDIKCQEGHVRDNIYCAVTVWALR